MGGDISKSGYLNNAGTPLTAASVKNFAQPGKYHDGEGVGLFLLVKPSGAKSWVQRVIRSKRREIGLGAYPLVSLAEARE